MIYDLGSQKTGLYLLKMVIQGRMTNARAGVIYDLRFRFAIYDLGSEKQGYSC